MFWRARSTSIELRGTEKPQKGSQSPKCAGKKGLRDQNFDAPEAVPDPYENSDTEDRPKGEEPTSANADPADELFAKAEVHLGTDERG